MVFPILPAWEEELYTKEFTPSGNYTSYKGKTFLQWESTNNCDYTDSSTITSTFTLFLPVGDSTYVLDLPGVIDKEQVTLFPNPTTGSISIPGALKYKKAGSYKHLRTNGFGGKTATYFLAGMLAGRGGLCALFR